MSYITDLPLMSVIMQAEKKHGINTHMIIEAIPKTEDEIEYPTESDVCWWVEFENEKKIFETFGEVQKYLLEEVVAKGDGPVVEFEE
jgi:hypothetical protein